MKESNSSDQSDPTNLPSLDTRVRDAVVPILDLEDDEMMVDALVIYTVISSEGETLHYIATAGLSFWKTKGMLICMGEMIGYYQPDDDDD